MTATADPPKRRPKPRPPATVPAPEFREAGKVYLARHRRPDGTTACLGLHVDPLFTVRAELVPDLPVEVVTYHPEAYAPTVRQKLAAGTPEAEILAVMVSVFRGELAAIRQREDALLDALTAGE